MAKISARGAKEVGRWVSLRTGNGYLLRSDGTLLYRAGDGWKTWHKRLKEGTDPYRWFSDNIVSDPEKKVGATPPSTTTLIKRSEKGVDKATDGCTVEPDGVCPHGYRSWLSLRGFV